jgi:hypothetical protein
MLEGDADIRYIAAVVEGHVRSSRAAELREGAAVLAAALASENDEDEDG